MAPPSAATTTMGGKERPDALVDVRVVRPGVPEAGHLDVVDHMPFAPVLLGVLARKGHRKDGVRGAVHDQHRELARGVYATERLQAERSGVRCGCGDDGWCPGAGRGGAVE